MLSNNKHTGSITVAIPALNEEKNIEATLQSVLKAAKTVPSICLEVLVIDDGSTDRTAEVTELFSLKYPNIRLIKNSKNMGLG